jgi:hypothetical protein
LFIETYCGAEKRLTLESTLVFTKKDVKAPAPWPDDIRASIVRELGEPVRGDA